MIKKKYFLLLSTLLLTILLSFFGTCYAKTVTQNEIRNFIYNAGLYNNKVWTETQLQSLQNYDFSSWITTIENNEGRWILTAGNPNWYQIELFSYTGNATNINKYGVYKSSNRLYVNTSYLTKSVKGVSIFGDVIAWYPSDMYETNFMYTDCNIYNNQLIANANILTSAGTYKPNNSIFDGPYRDDSFEIDINADFRNNKATISNDTSGTEYYLIPYTSDKVRIGNMFDYSNLSAVIKRKFRYKQSTRSFDLIQEFESDTNNLEFYDISEDTLIVFEYCEPDTTEFITFVPKEDTGFSQFTVPIYYTSANTSIVNGVIDTDNTFSGDNYTNYNNDTNTDKIINNNNENDDFWKRTYDGLFTLNSGDIEDLNEEIKTMLNTEELSGIEDEINFFEGFQNAEPGDLRISWNPILYDNMKIIPSGDINFSGIVREIPALGEVMRVTRILIIGALAWLGIKEVWRTICILLGIGYEIYDDHEEEDEIVVSQHETWNYNTGQATISTTRKQGRNSVTVVGKAPLRKRIE